MKSIEHAVVMNGAFAGGAMEQALAEARMAEERLPFTVRVVLSEEALHKAIAIRQSAYARHVPGLADRLADPEPNDHDRGSIVLLAESRLDGSPVGTVRIQTNRFNDLSIEQGVRLPAWLRSKSLAEATRLGVDVGRTGRVVKIALLKALYLYCIEANIEWLIVGARSPLDRQYDAYLFQDLFPGQFIPMPQFNNIPHRVLGFDILGARARWEEARHPLLEFMCYTRHPDIDLGSADFLTRSRQVRTADLSDRVAIGA